MSTGTRHRAQKDSGKRARAQTRAAALPLFSRIPDRPFRFLLAGGLLALIALAIVVKLVHIQLIDAENLKRKAQLSRNQALTLYNRGRILDRNGMVLAQDTILYDLFAHPAYYNKAKPIQLAEALSPALQMDVPDLVKKFSEPYSTIGVKKNLTREMVAKIKAARLETPARDGKTKKLILDEQGRPVMRRVPVPGLDLVKKTVRNYPQGSLAAHVLGYVNDEAQVSAGIEASAAAILKKRPDDLGKTITDGRGNLVALDRLDPKHLVNIPKAEDVQLTIDARLQYIAERELAAGLERTKAKRGTVIMMDPRTGEILAFAVLPTYQPSEFYKASHGELKNWALTDVYPPGSTFKILTVAAGLEAGVIDKNSRILDTGKMTVGGWTIQNYDYGKHGAPGHIDLIYLLMHSSNIASAKISTMIPVKQHHDILKRVGVGQKTGIDIPGESAGILLPPKDWDESTHATIGYGYGMASTPLQMAAAISSIANSGVWSRPHLLKGTPVEQRRVFSEETSRTMRDLLARSIREAKTSTVRLDEVAVAGKTGTSRKPKENGRGYDPDVFTSFVGFFPAETPRVLMMVVVDSPQVAEAWGSTVAGPIFRAVAKETISHLGLAPVKIAPKAERLQPSVGGTSRRQEPPVPPAAADNG